MTLCFVVNREDTTWGALFFEGTSMAIFCLHRSLLLSALITSSILWTFSAQAELIEVPFNSEDSQYIFSSFQAVNTTTKNEYIFETVNKSFRLYCTSPNTCLAVFNDKNSDLEISEIGYFNENIIYATVLNPQDTKWIRNFLNGRSFYTKKRIASNKNPYQAPYPLLQIRCGTGADQPDRCLIQALFK